MNINTDAVVKKVNSLIQLDIDAIHLYKSAIDKLDTKAIKNQLTLFQSDHENHVRRFSEAVQRLGGIPPEYKKDIMGHLLNSLTAIRSITGTEGALKAMQSNEKLTNKTYETALTFEFPVDIMNIVRQNREDERRHLEYIENCLAQRTWESQEKAA